MDASMTVLVVVADKAVYPDVLACLQELHASSRGVHAADQAVAALLENPPSLVVSDLANASEIARALASMRHADPVSTALLVVGPNTVENATAAFQIGANGYAPLPLAAKSFQNACRTAITDCQAYVQALQTAYERGAADERAVLSAQVQSESLGLMSRLAANIAHEINNPLTPILGLAEMVSEEAPPESTASVASRTIIESGRRIAAAVRSLMGFTRPLSLLEQIDLRLLVAETLQGMQQALVDQHIQIHVVQPEQPLRITVSVAEMRQALFLMLEHARVRMPNGGTLELVLESNAPAVIIPNIAIAIKDSGTPIPSYHLPHIFEPFYTATGPGIGLGPGLAITRRIVEQHGGTIAFEPGTERGNTLRIILPVR